MSFNIKYIRDYEKKYEYLDWASRLVCRYGLLDNFDFYQLKETNNHNLEYDLDLLYQNLDYKKVAWYIHNYFYLEENGYDISFLRGVAQHGSIYTNYRYPSFFWSNNKNIDLYFLSSNLPYFNIRKSGRETHYCQNIPLLYMQYEKNHRYIAGLLAMGKLDVYPSTGFKYAFYPEKFEEIFFELKIPIDVSYMGKIGISPVWPALGTHEYPNFLKKSWIKIKGAYLGNYPEIILRTYIQKGFDTKTRIPYCHRKNQLILKYNKLGGMKFLDKYIEYKNMWIVDSRMQKLINSWKIT